MDSKIANRAFEEPFWPVERVIAWIGFRDPSQFDANWIAAKAYPHLASVPLIEPSPATTLLQALQRNTLRAIKDGEELSDTYWAHATVGEWPDVRFRRGDVVALWPRLIQTITGNRASLSGREAPAWERSGATQRDAAMRALEAIWPDGRPLGQLRTIANRVNAWLKDHNGQHVSDRTIARALRELRRCRASVK